MSLKKDESNQERILISLLPLALDFFSWWESALFFFLFPWFTLSSCPSPIKGEGTAKTETEGIIKLKIEDLNHSITY